MTGVSGMSISSKQELENTSKLQKVYRFISETTGEQCEAVQEQVGMIREITRPLLQEIYQPDGWKMLVCCMLLNCTNRKQVDTIREKLFSTYPTAKDMSNADETELSQLLKPLGLYNKRAKSLKRMSDDYLSGFESVDELYGIGQYGKDSWQIFQNNDMSVNPTDKVLQEYLRVEWKRYPTNLKHFADGFHEGNWEEDMVE